VRAVSRDRSIRRTWLAFFLYCVGEIATWLAITVYAFARGGATEAGVVALVQLVPATLVAPFASVLADRLHREPALRVGYGLQAITTGATALAIGVDAPALAVYALATAVACAMTMTRPVHFALLPDLADDPESLTVAIAGATTAEALAHLIGPLLAGVLLAVSGPDVVFAVAALGAAASLLLTLRLRHHGADWEPTDAAEIIAESPETVSRMLAQRGVVYLTLLVGARYVLIGMLDVLLIDLAVNGLGATESFSGPLLAACGVGALLGAFAAVPMVSARRLVPWVVFGAVLTGAPLVFVTAGGRALALGLLAASGAGNTVFDIAGRCLLPRAVSSDTLGRIFGLQEAACMGGLAIGAIAAPAVLSLTGRTGAFAIGGALLPVLTVVGWRRLAALDTVAPDTARVAAMIRQLPLFAPLPPARLASVAAAFRRVHLRPATVVIREGDPGDRFYVIDAGEVRISIGGVPVRTMGPGTSFGEIALLNNVPRTATVTAGGPVTLLALDREEFLAAVTGTVGTSIGFDLSVDDEPSLDPDLSSDDERSLDDERSVSDDDPHPPG
jgi:MFS family permease